MTGDAYTRSLSHVLRLVATGEATTRTDLARVTGLARSTIGERVEALRSSQVLTESDMGRSTGGRPAIRLQLNTAAGVLLGADLGARHWRLAVTDLGGTPLAEQAGEFDIGEGPGAVLGQVRERFDAMLSQLGRSPAQVRAVGVGVPGPVEFSTGTVIRPPIMPGWDGAHVPEHFTAAYPAPVLVDNDVNVMALGESYARRGDLVELLLLVKIGTGIGCGIVDRGRVHRGADGAAGDIGHVKFSENDQTPCTCGNLGCIEAVASGRALVRQLADAGFEVHSTDDVVRLALSGVPEAVRCIRVAARRIGEVVATLVNFYNPSRIVLGGPLAPVHDDLLAGIRSVVYQHATPLATRALTLEASELGDRAGVVGAVVLARDHVLSTAGVRHLMGSGTPVDLDGGPVDGVPRQALASEAPAATA